MAAGYGNWCNAPPQARLCDFGVSSVRYDLHDQVCNFFSVTQFIIFQLLHAVHVKIYYISLGWLNAMEDLNKSVWNAGNYPKNLLPRISSHYDVEEYHQRLADDSSRLFCDDQNQASVSFWDINIQSIGSSLHDTTISNKR